MANVTPLVFQLKPCARWRHAVITSEHENIGKLHEGTNEPLWPGGPYRRSAKRCGCRSCSDADMVMRGKRGSKIVQKVKAKMNLH